MIEGISYQTFRVWRDEKPAFSAVLKKAEAQCKAARVKTILDASEKQWQAAAWWLERKFPDEYGRQQTIHTDSVPPVYFGFTRESHFIKSEGAVDRPRPQKKVPQPKL